MFSKSPRSWEIRTKEDFNIEGEMINKFHTSQIVTVDNIDDFDIYVTGTTFNKDQ